MKKNKIKLHFRRLELKYLIPTKLADLVIPTVTKYMNGDDHANNSGFYYVNSIYYDSPNLKTYQQKLDGILFRKKYRLRHYNNEVRNFFEIKRKIGDTVIKDRVVLNEDLPERNDVDIRLPHLFKLMRDSDTKSELQRDAYVLKLAPVVYVKYKRFPFVTKFSDNLRVTLDYDLMAYNVSSISHVPKKLSFVDPGMTVLEIKSNARIASWLGYLIKSHNLTRYSFSKYARSIDRVTINN